jgi:hypothetical protein
VRRTQRFGFYWWLQQQRIGRRTLMAPIVDSHWRLLANLPTSQHRNRSPTHLGQRVARTSNERFIHRRWQFASAGLNIIPDQAVIFSGAFLAYSFHALSRPAFCKKSFERKEKKKEKKTKKNKSGHTFERSHSTT